MNGILQRLMEGDSNIDNMEIDPAIESEISESTMPVSMLIDSFYVNETTEINRAIEIFEMASIIDTTRILQEGTNVSEAAAVVLEGAIKDFFTKIIDKIKEIGHWIAGIFRKILHRGKDEETAAKDDINKKLPEVKEKVMAVVKDEGSGASDAGSGSDKPAEKESPVYTYRGAIWNNNGDKAYDSIIKLLEDMMGNMEKKTVSMSKASDAAGKTHDISKGPIIDKMNEQLDGDTGDSFSVASITAKILKDVFKQSNIQDLSSSNVVNKIKDSYVTGKLTPNSAPHKVTPDLLKKMEELAKGGNNVTKSIMNAQSSFEKRRKSIESNMITIKKKFEADNTIAKTNNLVQRCTDIISSVTALGTMYTQVSNAKKESYLAILKSYKGCINNIANIKKKNGEISYAPDEDANDRDYSTECIGLLDVNMASVLESYDDYDTPSYGNNYGGSSSDSSIFSQLGSFLST